MDAVATVTNFERLPAADQVRYRQLLLELEHQRLSCRCIMAGGRDFTVIVGKGYATARFWLDQFNLGRQPHDTP